MRRGVKFDGKNLDFEYRDDTDLSVLAEIFIEREYRPVEEILAQAKFVVDIGAHIGAFSIYAAALNPDLKILAFEPDEDNIRLAKLNAKINRLKDFQIKGVAVGGEEGLVEFFLNENSHNHSIFRSDDSQKSRKVQMTNLDKIIGKCGVVDLVKIDSEGAEFDILENVGLENLRKVRNFFIEYHLSYGRDFRELVEILQRAKFKTRQWPSPYDKNFGFIFARA